MIGIDALISLVVYLIVIGLVLWLLWWLIDYCGLPEPFNKVARVVLAVVSVLLLIGVLLSFVGHPILR